MKKGFEELLRGWSYFHEKQRTLREDAGVLYLTSFDPFQFRRPFLAKSALPDLRIINYIDAYRRCMGALGKSLDFMYQVVRTSESWLLKTPRFCLDGYLASAYLYDLLHFLPISKIKAKIAG